MEGFLQNSREIAQIVGGQNVGSMHVKRSDPEKDWNFTFLWPSKWANTKGPRIPGFGKIILLHIQGL